MHRVQSQLQPHLTEDDLVTIINDKILAPFQIGSEKHDDAVSAEIAKLERSGFIFDPSLGKHKLGSGSSTALTAGGGGWIMFHDTKGWQQVSEQQVGEELKSKLLHYIQNGYMQSIVHIRNVLKRRDLYQASPRLRETIREHAKLATSLLKDVEDTKTILKEAKDIYSRNEFTKNFDTLSGKLAFNDAERSGAVAVFDATTLTITTDLSQIKAMQNLKRLGLMFSPLQSSFKCPEWLKDVGHQLSKVMFNCGKEENGVYVFQVCGGGAQPFADALQSALGTYCVNFDSPATPTSLEQAPTLSSGLRCCITENQATLTKKMTEMNRANSPIVIVFNSGSDLTHPLMSCQRFASIELPVISCSPEEVMGWLVDCLRSSASSAKQFHELDHSIQHKSLLKQFLLHRKWSATETSNAPRRTIMTIKAVVTEICEWGATKNYKSIVITHAQLAQYLKEEGFHVTRPQNTFKAIVFCRDGDD